MNDSTHHQQDTALQSITKRLSELSDDSSSGGGAYVPVASASQEPDTDKRPEKKECLSCHAYVEGNICPSCQFIVL